jgi:hypothetical protein
MEDICGKNKNGKWVCIKCMGQDHTFRDKVNYTTHINSNTHKEKMGERIKTKEETLIERNTELEARVKYLEKQIEALRIENKELKLEKQIEERIRREQPKLQTVEVGIPKNEVIEPKQKKPKLKEGSPERYLEETYKNPKNIFMEIQAYIENNEEGEISEILSNVSCSESIKPEIIQLIEYCKGSIFCINNKHYFFSFPHKQWVGIDIEMSIVIQQFNPLIDQLISLHRETYNSKFSKREIMETIFIPQTNKLWIL